MLILKRWFFVYLLSLAAALMISSVASADEERLSDEAKQVASWLAGHFDSSLQAASDPEYFNVSLKSCEVAVVSGTGEVQNGSLFLYVEQAIAGREAAPYRQRIYRIGDSINQDGAFVESEIMTLSNPNDFVGFCSKPQSLRSVSAEEIDERGCSVFLQRDQVEQGELRFTGRTPQAGCPSDFRGAVSVESYVSLGQNDLVAWDIGRDSDGNQVWGPVKGPYRFVRK